MSGYAYGQLSKAFLTATTHEDPETRRRADERAQRWMRALDAIASGQVVVGSRRPVAGLPPWVTLEVLRGGFASGRATAEGPLAPDEIALAQRVGVPSTRRMLFGYYLTDVGLAELNSLLDKGTYRIEVTEDAALLAVAWLVRAGDRAGALELLDELSPFADRLRFAPKVSAAPTLPADHVWRLTVADARTALQRKRQQARVETQREALAVWNPFADRVLGLWRTQFSDGQLVPRPTEQWLTAARFLLDEYERLARVHTACTKHRKPKENLAILLAALREVANGHPLSARLAGLLRTAVNGMVAKRGWPESEQHAAVREIQRAVAEAPAHRALAGVAAQRLAGANQAEGLSDPRAYVYSVTADEAAMTGVHDGAAMPAAVGRVLRRAHAAPVETLMAERVVPSAEVLAELVPRISATVVASTYADPALAALMAANYRAFRKRRSLLLLNFAKQVQLAELPWVRAAAAHCAAATNEPTSVLQRVAALALDHFPGTILPNPLVRELDQLRAAAGSDVPLVEELAADIFMGDFSDKYRRAAGVAGSLLAGTLYADYYAIDYARLAELAASKPVPRWWPLPGARHSGPTFGSICHDRAFSSSRPGSSVAANGTVIEQAQILTTHNLAALVVLGVRPEHGWTELADLAFARVVELLDLTRSQDRPLPTVKDAAYAWRQAIFYLSLAPRSDVDGFLARASEHDVPGLRLVVGGLAHVVAGGRFDADGTCPGGRRFLGWTTGRHWVVSAVRA